MTRKNLDVGATPGSVTLPLDAVTEAFAYLGVRGAGKSNLARCVAEEMFEAKLPFVAVDPIGSWYGLRSNRAGTGPGLPVPIFGGEHGDWKLDRASGAEVAELVVGENLSCLVDTSQFENEVDRRTFLLAFARRLYFKNRTPRHLFLEEADDYLPQSGSGELVDELVRAFVTIVRRGRQRGLGVTMLTQRSASLSKDVLSQAGTLVAFRSTSPHDRDSIRKWLRDNTDEEAALADSLPTLEDGEAILWSPNLLRSTRRVRFRLCRTFDSGKTATLEDGHRAPATLADVDVAALGRRLAATAERVREEDPTHLRRRVAELTDKVRVLERRGAPTEEMISRADRAELGAVIGSATKVGDSVAALAKDLISLAEDVKGKATFIQLDLGSLTGAIERARAVTNGARLSAALHAPTPPPRETKQAVRREEGETTPQADLSPSERKILDAIAWWGVVGGDRSVDRDAAAWRAGYASGGGRFIGLLAGLRRRGLVEYPDDNHLRLTGEGPALVAIPQGVHDRQALHADIEDRLSPSEVKLFRALVAGYPQAMSNAALAAETDYEAEGGRFIGLRAALRRYGLIEYPSDGSVRLRDVLVPDRVVGRKGGDR